MKQEEAEKGGRDEWREREWGEEKKKGGKQEREGRAIFLTSPIGFHLGILEAFLIDGTLLYQENSPKQLANEKNRENS